MHWPAGSARTQTKVANTNPVSSQAIVVDIQMYHLALLVLRLLVLVLLVERLLLLLWVAEVGLGRAGGRKDGSGGAGSICGGRNRVC